MMTEKPAPDTSMDEILASIRQIIATESKEEAHQPFFPINENNDILDLTDELTDELGNTRPPFRPSEVQFDDIGEWTPPTTSDVHFEEQDNNPQDVSPQVSPYPSAAAPVCDESLVSQSTLSEATHAFHLLNKVARENSQSDSSQFPGAIGDKPLENLIREMLKPLLKEWLDAHLPSLVRSVVTQQVEKIADQADGTSYESTRARRSGI